MGCLSWPLFRQQARWDCVCLKSKALSPKCAFWLKAIFSHHTCLQCMKLHQGRVWGTLGLQSVLQITFQTSEKLQFNSLLQRREMGVQGEENWEYHDLQALQITFRDVPNAPCLSRSLQVISGQSVTQLCDVHRENVVGKCCCYSWEVLVYINGMRNLAWFLPCPSPGCYFSLCHCCKWDLTKMIFSFPIVTEILLWALSESPSPCADTVGAQSVKFEPTRQTGTSPSSIMDSLRWCWGGWISQLAAVGKKATVTGSEKKG